jgi:hypothetical protein
MSAPTPYSGPLPLLFTGSYLKRTPGTGNLYVGSYAAAGGGGTVFDDLVNPPTTGVAAETASLEAAQDVGTTALTSPTNGKSYYTAATVSNLVKKNFDWVMNFYLTNSIARDNSGVPIP